MGKDGKKVAMLQNSCTSISTFLQLVSEQIKKEIRVLAPLPPPPPRNGEGGSTDDVSPFPFREGGRGVR